MLAVMRCDPCGKSFTGPTCYNQHMESEKHKKKVKSLGLQNSSNGTDTQAASIATQISQQTFECPICKIAFNSISNFKIHAISPEHAQKIIEKNSEKSIAPEVTLSSNCIFSSVASNHNESIQDIESDTILSPSEMIKSQTLTFATCTICNKVFSGPEPYKQHIESASHIKKVELEKNSASGIINQNIAPFSCDTCKKVFSGQVPYLQHMKSEIHRKKMLSLQLLGKGTSEVDSISDTKELKADENIQNNTWFCNVCEILCSGFIPYQQHLSGATHLKNSYKRENYNFKSEDTMQLAFQDRSKGKNILNTSNMVNGGNIKDGNGNMDADYILHGMIDNIKVLSSEELERSVTIFLPNDVIDFDKSDTRINTNSVNEENYTSEDSEVHEIKENTIVSQKCDFCNINLISKEEAINHYESLVHFSKRWQ